MSIINMVKSGISVIPVKEDKRPAVKWTEYQSKLPSLAEVKKWLEDFDSFALICGKGHGDRHFGADGRCHAGSGHLSLRACRPAALVGGAGAILFCMDCLFGRRDRPRKRRAPRRRPVG